MGDRHEEISGSGPRGFDGKKRTITSYLAENDEYEVSSVKDPEKGKLANKI